ncbi:hypothetical protein [Flavobacterium sp. TAB 87]|uniref:hypothetical protein n=1 Tax=Flavobacterium sp. TAB 87 TaxID=1729581 RepID=UPI00082ED7B5|nr:hypothetical protein [Flavobacterium sp. TAB 87]
MMRKLYLIIILSTFNIHSQSILTALNFGKTNIFYSDKIVKQTTEENTFYNSKNIEKTKNIIYFNNHNKVTLELRFDENDNLKQRLTRIYDSTGTRSLGRKIENWHPLLGHFSETAIHQYDSNGFLNNITEKDNNQNIISQTIIINNEKGYPIELSNFNRNESQGKETADYNYDKNEAYIKYFNKNGELINSETSKIEFKNGKPGDTLSQYGDVIKSDKYEMEIKYDKYGNWVKKIYSTISNGQLQKKSETIRKIIYSK